jgi:hypothetical protein
MLTTILLCTPKFQYNFVTSYTSLLIIVPEKHGESNRRIRYAPSTETDDLLRRMKERKTFISKSQPAPATFRLTNNVKRWKNYSVHEDVTNRKPWDPRNRQSLTEYLDFMILDQGEL